LIDGWLHLSLRTFDRDADAGKVARHLGGRRGFGGGHQSLAAAQIPLPPELSSGPQVRRVVRGLVRRFLKMTGAAAEPPQPLCEPNSS
jgi:nanoRNase/pAp phosphatase (c-di-AMP/oligoRNAs hydrolase)